MSSASDNFVTYWSVFYAWTDFQFTLSAVTGQSFHAMWHNTQMLDSRFNHSDILLSVTCDIPFFRLVIIVTAVCTLLNLFSWLWGVQET